MEMMGLSEKSYRNGALCSPPHPHFFFCFPSPPLYPLPPPLLSPAYPLSWTPQCAAAAQVLTHTFSGQARCLRMTLPGQEQWSNLSFLPELTTALAVAAALFSSPGDRGCKENRSKLWASSLHSHSLTCNHSTRRIPGTYRTSQQHSASQQRYIFLSRGTKLHPNFISI